MSELDHYRAILSDTAKAGVYHMPQVAPEPLMEAAAGIGFAVFRIDLAQAKDKMDLLDAIGRAMSFPAWFGHNLDALGDCLADMAWRPADGYFVLLQHCDGIHGLAEGDFVGALQTFEEVADDWREQGIPFWCFVEMQADGINWLPDIP
ncbi:MAG TPA: barstar family protein [Rhodocyclaceae bacterium]